MTKGETILLDAECRARNPRGTRWAYVREKNTRFLLLNCFYLGANRFEWRTRNGKVISREDAIAIIKKDRGLRQ